MNSKAKPQFSLMDAHNLQFEDESFDFVFGAAILHHLNMVTALNEIHRVLRARWKNIVCRTIGYEPCWKDCQVFDKKG